MSATHLALNKRTAPTHCTVPACGKRTLARGWCPMHYSRMRRHGELREPTHWSKGRTLGPTGRPGPWAGKPRGPMPQAWRDKIAVSNRKPKTPAHVAKILANWCPGRRRVYRGIAMRSTYETRVAACLDGAGLQWEYEPTTFDLGTCHYTPDFRLTESGIYIEVKGYLGQISREKPARLRAVHPEIPLVVLDRGAILAMERGEKACPGLPLPDGHGDHSEHPGEGQTVAAQSWKIEEGLAAS